MIGAAFALAGCVSEAERYAWNVANVRVCENARKLTHSQVTEIARVVAHASRQNAITIRTLPPDYSLRKVLVGTAFPVALRVENPDRNSFGFCILEPAGSSWKITELYTNVDPMLAFTRCE
jgi:hypothetical protein